MKPRIWTVAQAKGGAGKSTLTLGIAAAMVGLRKNVIVVDSDTTNTCIGASLNRRNAFRKKDGFSVPPLTYDTLVSHTQMIKSALSYNAKGFDVVIDCNAAMEDFVLTALTIADVIVLPSRPGRWDLEAWKRMTPWLEIVFANRKRQHLSKPKVFSLITDAGKSKVLMDMDEFLQGYKHAKYLGQIRHSKVFQDLSFDGIAMWEVMPENTIAKEFKGIIEQIIS